MVLTTKTINEQMNMINEQRKMITFQGGEYQMSNIKLKVKFTFTLENFDSNILSASKLEFKLQKIAYPYNLYNQIDLKKIALGYH